MAKRGMRVVQIQSVKNQVVIADECFVAESFFHRLRGLIGMKRFDKGQGIFFPRCNDIHMWFMSVPIDVVFLRAGTVCSVHESIRPWRLLPLWDRRASDTLELPAGTARRCEIQPGDELCLS